MKLKVFVMLVSIATVALLISNVQCFVSPHEPHLSLGQISEFCPDTKTKLSTKDPDPDWVSIARDLVGLNDSTVFYYPLASKSHVFLLTENLLGTTSGGYENENPITEAQLVNSCLVSQFHFHNGQVKPYFLISFCGYQAKRCVTRLNFKRFAPEDKEFSKDQVGSYHLSLTDNKSYVVWDVCRDNGLRTFIVMSTQKTLTTSQQEQIKAHLRGVGFVEDFFMQLNYADCWKAPAAASEDDKNRLSSPNAVADGPACRMDDYCIIPPPTTTATTLPPYTPPPTTEEYYETD